MYNKILDFYENSKRIIKNIKETLSKLGMIMFLYIGLIAIAIVRIIFEFDLIHIFLLIYMLFYVVQYILVKLR